MNDALPYRPNVCLLIMNHAAQLFLGERFGSPGIWQFPQGGIEPGASEEESALREASEELGIDESLLAIRARFQATHVYDYRNIPPYAVGKWRGQRQTFWLLEFLGVDSDIQLDRHEQEFSQFCWCSIEEVRMRAEPQRLAGYEAPLREFQQYLERR